MKQILIIAVSMLLSLATIAQDKKQCQGITKAGTQCQHKTSSIYCKQHDQSIPVIRCGAKTKAGTPCKNRVKVDGDKCHNHKVVTSGIIKRNVSKDGISVIYVTNKDTFALDYLTKQEYADLKLKLSNN